jgi:tRNA threonylcarbamoyladenosine biosynthesis protein TsaB
VSSNKRPLILSIETATRAGSIALTRGDALLAVSTGDPSVSHSAHLLEDVSRVLEKGGAALDEVELFAVALGPGSFTGLRIGLATVKSFAATLMRPCVGVSTLHATAHAAGESRQTLALLPAGRGELFAQLLSVERNGEVLARDAPAYLTPQKLLAKYGGETSLKWAGEGAHIHLELIRARAKAEGIKFLVESQNSEPDLSAERLWALAPLQSALAVNVAELALRRFDAADVESPGQLSAIYVRPSDAELHA